MRRRVTGYRQFPGTRITGYPGIRNVDMKNSLLKLRNSLLTASLLALLAAAPSPALAAPGDLDTSFDTDGIVTSNPSSSIDLIYAAILDASGIYLVGTDEIPGNTQWRVEKHDLTTGALLWERISNPSSSADVSTAVTVDVGGVYAAGYDSSISGGNPQWRVEKRDLVNGNPIAGFGTGGVVTSNPSNGVDPLRGLASDASSIYIVGADSSPGTRQWHIEKRRSDTGVLCTAANCGTAFDTDGIVTSNPSAFLADQAAAITIDSNYMYVVGFDSNTVTSNYQWRIEKRRLDTGALCTAANCGTEFGTGGAVTSDPSTSSDEAQSIAIDSTYMYVAGYDAVAGYYRWRIEKRRLDTGALETAFDTDGIVTISPCAAAALIYAIVVDSSAIYVAGSDNCGSGSQWRIEKRDRTSGALISSFGTNGIVTSDPSASADGAYAIKIDSNKIYVAGYDSSISGSNTQWRIEKRESGSGGGGGGGVDCGVRMYDGTATINLSCENPPVSPLRIQKGATTYGIQLVPTADPNASKLRIQIPGGVKALRKQ